MRGPVSTSDPVRHFVICGSYCVAFCFSNPLFVINGPFSELIRAVRVARLRWRALSRVPPMSSPDLPVTIPSRFRAASFAMAAHSRIQGHGHDGWHLLEVHEGSFEEEGLGHLRRGDFRLSPPGSQHEIAVADSVVRCRNIHLTASGMGRRLPPGVAHNQLVVRRSFSARSLPVCGPLAEALQDAELFAWAFNVMQDPDYRGPSTRLEEARRTILETSRPITRIARDVGMTAEHLSRSFSRHFGSSPVQVRNEVRVQRVMDALGGDDRPLAELALDVGFSDQSHMTNTLRHRIGLAPGQVRRALRSRSLAV